ncbi:MAG: hypothetical protein ACRDZ4_16825 [Egibacteraceae bacterium]
MFRVFLRWSPNVNRLRRPGWFSDRRCVENALVAMKSAESTVTLVSDVTPSGEIADLDWDSAVRLPAGTNSGSFLRALDLALDAALPGDVVYLLEQDYLHVGDALPVILDGLGITRRATSPSSMTRCTTGRC